jgi:drug/metabolite transporter (DMT)-like permease
MPIIEKPSRLLAIVESLVVTAIWASSFVFVKFGLNYMGPLTVAGLRYFLAFLVLLPFMTRNTTPVRPLPRRLWVHLSVIGLSAYAVGNGTLFWGLKYIPATMGSFLMSLIPLLVLLVGVAWLKEVPTHWQIVGVVISLIGSVLFFSPGLQPEESPGVAIVLVGLVGFTLFGVLGREAARDRQIGTLFLTAVPLAIGGGFLLLIALPLEGIPVFTTTAWSIVLWLAIVNTAFAYVLYNHSLQVLTALEMNVMLNLTPLGTAFLAWLFLDESLSIAQIIGIVTVIIGVILVQQARPRWIKSTSGLTAR